MLCKKTSFFLVNIKLRRQWRRQISKEKTKNLLILKILYRLKVLVNVNQEN